jgi:aminopeptidase N
MLRHKLGDEIFWKGIRAYYKSYQNANAMTVDFRKIMEKESGEDLEEFFRQWLFVKGYPELKWNWKYSKGKLRITIKQVQPQHIFDVPVEFGIVQNGVMKIETVELTEKSASVAYELESKPEKVLIDPEVWLLFEEK